jgi:DNA-binding beta-propeller fold protein YncE
MRKLLSFIFLPVVMLTIVPPSAYSQSAEYIFFSRELFAMTGSNYIGRVNFDGSNATDIQTTSSLGSNRPYGLAVDWKNNKLYYTTRGTHTIKRTNLDGSGLETVISSGLSDPIDLQVDSENGKIYWSEGELSN